MVLPRTQQELVVWYIEHVGFESFFASWHTEHVWTAPEHEEVRMHKLYFKWLEYAVDNFNCTCIQLDGSSMYEVRLNGILIYTLSTLSHCPDHNRILTKLLAIRTLPV